MSEKNLKSFLNLNIFDLSISVEENFTPRSSSSVLLRSGNSVLLCTACVKENFELDNANLVNIVYKEKYSAASKIPGGFFKRESRQTDRETLISRFIDRSIRPILNDNLGSAYKTQITCELLSYDKNISSKTLSVLASSIVLYKMPELNINCISIAISNPLITAAYTKKGVISIDFDGKNVNKENIINTLKEHQEEALGVIEKIEQHYSELKKNKNSNDLVRNLKLSISEDVYYNLCSYKNHLTYNLLCENSPLTPLAKKKIESILKQFLPQSNYEGYVNEISQKLAYISEASKLEILNAIKILILDYMEDKLTVDKYKSFLKKTFSDVVHDKPECYENTNFELKLKLEILKVKEQLKKDIINNTFIISKTRSDSRGFDQVRDIKIEYDLLPSSNGSAVFQRGMTKVLSTVTFGSKDEMLMNDDISGESREKFFLHYNFPSYAVNEFEKHSNLSRREVGHGKLAWKALKRVFPKKFYYSTRVNADVLSSDGSSSMATVCSGYIAMKTAGIPLEECILGIAMGMYSFNKKNQILTDLNEYEDFNGYIDFKIAANMSEKTNKNRDICVIQMDVKNLGVKIDLISKVIDKAFTGLKSIYKPIQEIEKKNFSIKDSAMSDEITLNDKQMKGLISSNAKKMKEISLKTFTKISYQGKKINIYGTSKNRENAKEMMYRIKFDENDDKVEKKENKS